MAQDFNALDVSEPDVEMVTSNPSQKQCYMCVHYLHCQCQITHCTFPTQAAHTLWQTGNAEQTALWGRERRQSGQRREPPASQESELPVDSEHQTTQLPIQA